MQSTTPDADLGERDLPANGLREVSQSVAVQSQDTNIGQLAWRGFTMHSVGVGMGRHTTITHQCVCVGGGGGGKKPIVLIYIFT